MNKFKLAVLAASFFLFSCESTPPNKKPILIGDSSLIVTEKDDRFLRNITEDISPTNKKTSEKRITEMMMKVDSAKSVQKLDREENAAIVRGFTINFSECEVVFQGLSAHAIQLTQDERTSNSVSYVHDAGNLSEIVVQVKGLDEMRLEQRLFTRLSVVKDEEEYLLADLGKFISPWSSLPGKEYRFISLGINSLEFFNVDHNKILNALDRELRKKKKSRQVIEEWTKAIAKTQGYMDAPCKTRIVSAQWRIIGKKNGKRVQKLIQFDLP